LMLGQKRDTGNPLTQAELDELKGLGEEQGELAELGAKFLRMFEKPEAEPDTEKKGDTDPASVPEDEEKKAE